MKIVETIITADHIEITLADNPDPALTRSTLTARLPIEASNSFRQQPLVAIQIEALRHLRAAIDAEIQAL